MVDKNKTPHIYVENLTRKDSQLGMLTDYFKAKKMNCYGKDPIINKIDIKKETIILQEKKNNVFIFGKQKTIPTLPFIKAAKIYGFDENLININFEDKLKDILIRVVYIYFGMSKLMFSLILEIIKYDKKCMEDYLSEICQNPLDDRIIMRINGV
jgi:hypothetical protein